MKHWGQWGWAKETTDYQVMLFEHNKEANVRALKMAEVRKIAAECAGGTDIGQNTLKKY